MANVFDISNLNPTLRNAKDKALRMAGEMGLNDVFGGRVLPPLPPFPKQAGDGYTSVEDDFMEDGQDFRSENWPSKETFQTVRDETFFSLEGTPMMFPLRIKLSSQSDNEWWLLPYEPIITIAGGHTLVRRQPRKNKRLRGTIKERWNTDDYSINIQGVLKNKDDWNYPESDIKKLRTILESRETIDVLCPLFEIFEIVRIAVEKFDFPFTKSEENQAYKITAFSDDDWSLFIEKKASPALENS